MKNKKFNPDYVQNIGEIAELFGISKSALRYYEKKGLITFPRTPNSNYRVFDGLSLVQISDILLFRNLNVPIKDIQNILNMPTNRITEQLDKITDNIQEQIDSYYNFMKQIHSYERRVLRYQRLKQTGYQIVNQPLLKKAIPYSNYDPELLRLYVRHTNNLPYTIIIRDPNHTEFFEEALGVREKYTSYELIWDASEYNDNFLECLTQTEYANCKKSTLSQHLQYMYSHDMKPGIIILEFLISDFSTEQTTKYDYYHTWIQIQNQKNCNA